MRISFFHSTQKVIVLLFFFLFFYPLEPLSAWTRASSSVPVTDPVYGDLDILIAHRLIGGVIVGQRPYTRSEIARLIGEALNRFNKQYPDSQLLDSQDDLTDQKLRRLTHRKVFLKSLLSQLEKEYEPELIDLGLKEGPTPFVDIHPLEQVDLIITYLDSPPRGYFDFQEPLLGYNPLVQFDQGRHYIDGSQYAWEATQRATVSPYASFYFRPRLQIQIENNQGQKENGFFVQELYGTTSFYNTQIDFGRKSISWGQARYGGMLISNNARALDGLQITNPTPWHIKYLGYLKYSFFFTNLGPEQNINNPFFTGLKVNLLPFPFLELGIARALILGGEGAPSGTFWQSFQDFFGIRPGDINTVNLSNSINGFELRGRIPPLRNMELYSEVYFEDFNASYIWRSLIQETGLLGGLYMPRLDDRGSLSLRLEGRKTSPLLYKHSIWQTGWRLNGLMIGDPLGPDAQSLLVRLDKKFNANTRGWYEFNFDRVDSNIYFFNGAAGRKVLIDGVAEKRWRNLIGLDHQLTKLLKGTVVLGYERVYNVNFISENDENNFLIQTGLSFNVDPFTQLRADKLKDR